MADTAADARPLDDRLGSDNPRWKVSVTYVDAGGTETTERGEIPVRNYQRVQAFADSPDHLVEMEAGRLARNVQRVRNRR